MVMGKNNKNKRLRKIELSSELQDAMRQQFRAFREKFGRDPGPEDPVFFDPESPTPAPIPLETLQREIVEVMTKARVSPEFIYAYCRTGLILTQENYWLLSPKDRAAWDLAVLEYYRRAPVRERLR
jgi:hypothetical protein